MDGDALDLCARERWEQTERLILCQSACFADASVGRLRQEADCPLRTCFQRDIDRIIHSKAFRRLKHKTQVFLSPEGDHYRTRMTHTLEVARIARTIARALRLNEDLTEAIAFGHDLGHTPFGHAGERALREICGHFEHNEQSLRVVDRLEKNGAGLNLCGEIRDGILTHTGDELPKTLEGKIVRLSDRLAYVNHDSDDAERAGILSEQDIPIEIRELLGSNYSKRINTVIFDIVNASGDDIRMSEHIAKAMDDFRTFMFRNVYENNAAKAEESKVGNILSTLYEHYIKNVQLMSGEYRAIADSEGAERAVLDYISGMTDQYAVNVFSRLFIPMGWHK